MKRFFFILAAAFFSSLASALALDASSTFAEANQAYAAGDFGKARGNYEALVRQGDHGANLFYNLGNAAWRMGDAGAAALNYQRALALQGDHPEAAENLKLVREKSGARVFPEGRSAALFPEMSANRWLLAGTITAWIFLFVLTSWTLRIRRGASALAGLICLLATAYAGAGWWRAEHRLDGAIIIARSADAHFAPLDNSPLAETLPAASEVRILQKGTAWTYCLLPTQKRAWIPSFALAPVRPSSF